MSMVAILLSTAACVFAEEPARRNANGAPVDVLCGADVIKRDNFKQLDGMRVALVTNQTGRDRDGNRLVDLLAGAKNVKLVRLLAPEHGLYGTREAIGERAPA